MPRTLAQNATYINETIKPAIKAAIEAQGVIVPSTDSFLDYADRIGEIEGGGSGYQLKDLPTGSISTVNDAAELPLNALKVSVEAIQSGSGTPSPSNIRPISGWDSGEITVCDDIQNPTQTETITQQFPQTIYGAEWDVVNGSLDNAKNSVVLDGITTGVKFVGFDNYGNNNRFYIYYSDTFPQAKYQSTLTYCLCDRIEPSFSYTIGIDPNMPPVYACYPHSTAFFITLPAAEYPDVATANSFLQQNNVQVCYKLATPTTIDLSPLSIRMLEGTNNVFADCGDVIDGEYFVDEGAIDVRKVDYQIGSSGSIKTTDGRVLSGFASMNGYHARPLDASGNWLDVDWSKDFEIGVAFKFTAFSSYQSIFGDGNANSYRKAPRIYYDNSEGKLALCVSSDGSTLAIDTYLNHTFTVDKWYFIKAKFVLSTMTFTVDISDDFSTFTSLYSGVMASAPYHNTASLSLGGEAQQSNMASNTFLIDTFNTYIKGDGVNWGASTGAFPS